MNPKNHRCNRELALAFPHIYAVEASAGAGKTFQLSQRYIDFLFGHSKVPIPFDFRNILAVTFSNEAANEMRSRILRLLKQKALDKSSPDKDRAQQFVDEILRNYTDFQVRTIDSFVHTLMVASSLQLRLPPYYEIMPDSAAYLEYALDDLLEEIAQDKQIREIFSGFLRHYLEVEGQKGWYPKRSLFAILSRLHGEQNTRAKQFLQVKEVNLLEWERALKQKIERFLNGISQLNGINKNFQKALSSITSLSGKDFLQGLARVILNRGSVFPDLLAPSFKRCRKGYPLGLDPSFKRFRKVYPLGLDEWEDIRKQAKGYLKAYVYLRYNFYLRVFAEFESRLNVIKDKKRIVFLDELNKKAKEFLRSENLVIADIYYKLSSVLYHYLIDEFQDTSSLQWQNMEVLIEDALSKGGSLFYVGDKKQAIYRFRGGEACLFDAVKEDFRNRVACVYEKKIKENYRSKQAIVEFNNNVWSLRNLENLLSQDKNLTPEYEKKILDAFSHTPQVASRHDKDGGYVYLEIIAGEDSSQRDEETKQRLKDILKDSKSRGFSFEDILILTRQNHEAEDIAHFLIESGYPVASSRTVSIRKNNLVLQIISFLKFLNSPIDNLSFVSFVMGEIFLQATGLKPEAVSSWLEDLRIKGFAGVLYSEFRHWQEIIWQDFIEYFLKSVGFLPVYDLVSSILFRFKVEENFSQALGFFKHLLEVIKDLEEQGRNSLSDFLDWFAEVEEEKLFVKVPQGLNAIRILTIHKAKGLEAPVVILPFAGFKVNVGFSPYEANKLVLEDENNLCLLYPQKDICLAEDELRSIYQREYFQLLLDELNCLYVALTRAADELYILIPEKINRLKNPLISLLVQNMQGTKIKQWGIKTHKVLEQKPGVCKRRARAVKTSLSPLQVLQKALGEQIINSFNIISQEKRKAQARGEVIHYILSLIEDIDIFLPHLEDKVEFACYKFGYSESGQIISALKEILDEPKMRQFFLPSQVAFNEKEIVDKSGNTRRIDRLILGKDTITILDYKSEDTYSQQHETQIKEYANLIKEIYPYKTYQGFLIYIDKKQIRQVSL